MNEYTPKNAINALYSTKNKLDYIVIGLPCKFTTGAIIPKSYYDFFNCDYFTAKCRGGEMVELELVKDYENDKEMLENDCKVMFGIPMEEYIEIWRRRCTQHTGKEGWVKVRMIRK